MNFTTLRFDSIDSTNLEAIRQAAAGAAEGLIVIAAEQAAGRGRAGRHWISTKGSGLYLSIVLRPKLEPQFLSLITLMTAVAVYDSLTKEFNIAADIKWPNDILVNEKKICGILAESVETSFGLAIVVGVGINLLDGNVTKELSGSSTSLYSELGRTSTSADLYRQILPALESSVLRFVDHWYRVLLAANGPAEIVDAWRKRSTYFSGKRVLARLQNESITATTDGLERNGALRVRRDDGELVVIHSGDVAQLRENIT
jgi:BirA family biotin operon repressor/biotin-[acetyl-CoA-carboxylase] ligase